MARKTYATEQIIGILREVEVLDNVQRPSASPGRIDEIYPVSATIN